LNYIYINGKITVAENALLPVDNGAFRYGYGLFESLLVQNGVIALKEYHWERLLAGIKVLHFELPALMTLDWMEEQLLLTVKKNQLEKLCRVRLQLFAGTGGIYDHKSMAPGMVIECFPLEPETLGVNENGFVTGIAKGLDKSSNVFANLKTCSGLLYALAAQQAKDNKWNDILIRNTAGNIIESSIANIFWISNGDIYTPPLTDGCVAGVTRQHIMEKMPVIEKSLNVETLLHADEVFLTNAIKRIRWVGSIENKKYSNRHIKTVYARCFV